MTQPENHYKVFSNEVEMLSRRHGRAHIFDDFLTVSLCCLHQVNIASRLQKKDPDNEALYLETIKGYSKEELKLFAKLLGTLQMSVYDEPYSDLLGEYFTEYITRGHNGQYFTPDAVCELMSRLHGANEGMHGKGIYDPACGSGRLLLNFAKVAPDNYFYANDLSYTCAKMTALNFMLNGLRGEVACMNSLSMEFNSAWQVNTPTLGVLPIDENQSQIWRSPPDKSLDNKKVSIPLVGGIVLGDQLSLF